MIYFYFFIVKSASWFTVQVVVSEETRHQPRAHGTRYLCSAGKALKRCGQSCICFPWCDNPLIKWHFVAFWKLVYDKTCLLASTMKFFCCSFLNTFISVHLLFDFCPLFSLFLGFRDEIVNVLSFKRLVLPNTFYKITESFSFHRKVAAYLYLCTFR